MISNLDDVLGRYGGLLAEVDAWFASATVAVSGEVACSSGCSECCRGLFDITLLDAWYMKLGFDRLPLEKKASVRAKAVIRRQELQRHWHELDEPYILNYRPEDEWEELMPEADETPCPLLDHQGHCLIYSHRPMTCRLHGMPLVDRSGEVFYEEWCSLNFVDTDPLLMKEIRGEFDRTFRNEMKLFREFTLQLLGREIRELDTLIPLALLFDLTAFDWKIWLEDANLVENPLID